MIKDIILLVVITLLLMGIGIGIAHINQAASLRLSAEQQYADGRGCK